ncbi:MAG: PocR ligand-binding domain-containing protein [Anaerolineaceae bacterium]|nr:PocR ligand-binding domain-containing protein [Anaerolineaceae bacterium]
MGELLTTKQLQQVLKIDRVTVYRMLNDGRLKGVKIGNHWRFPQSEIDKLIGEEKQAVEPENNIQALTDFPTDCVQRVQEIFAGIIGIGAVTVSLRGEQLTKPTYSNTFCQLMLSNPSGREACQASWRKIALRSSGEPPFQTCHAGLSYKRSRIDTNDRLMAWLIAGQFYTTAADPTEEDERLEQLAKKHALPLAQLTEAARKIPVLKKYQQEKVQEWTPKVANTVQSILCERSTLMDRLQRIAEISTIHPAL